MRAVLPISTPYLIDYEYYHLRLRTSNQCGSRPRVHSIGCASVGRKMLDPH